MDVSGIRRVAITTGGGDAPGLNAVIHSAVFAARRLGWDVQGIRDGYDGLLEPGRFSDGGLVPLRRGKVRGIAHLGGTILGTTNRGNPFAFPSSGPDGTAGVVDRSDELVRRFRELGIDALIAIGGDGSLAIARRLSEMGLRVVGVPKTIDNDIEATAVSFGFDSAVAFATECLDRLHSTARSHRRTLVVEVMGRHAGWIALYCGVAGGADAILIPEIPYRIERVAEHLRRRRAAGRAHAIVVVAEGARPLGGEPTVKSRPPGGLELLGGIGEKVADQLQDSAGCETRTVVLGHLLRGGSPTATDRVLALTFGAAAVRALAEGRHAVMVALRPPGIEHVPLALATGEPRLVPPDADGIVVARALDICFGDGY